MLQRAFPLVVLSKQVHDGDTLHVTSLEPDNARRRHTSMSREAKFQTFHLHSEVCEPGLTGRGANNLSKRNDTGQSIAGGKEKKKFLESQNREPQVDDSRKIQKCTVHARNTWYDGERDICHGNRALPQFLNQQIATSNRIFNLIKRVVAA